MSHRADACEFAFAVGEIDEDEVGLPPPPTIHAVRASSLFHRTSFQSGSRSSAGVLFRSATSTVPIGPERLECAADALHDFRAEMLGERGMVAGATTTLS